MELAVDQSFLDEINKYHCAPEGWNYLRDVYLKQILTLHGSTVISPGFVKRRQMRVWPVASEPSQAAQPSQPAAGLALICDPDADPGTCSEQNER